jgi:hypothetical protein
VSEHNAVVSGASVFAVKYVGTIVSPYNAEAAPAARNAIKANFIQPFAASNFIRKTPFWETLFWTL